MRSETERLWREPGALLPLRWGGYSERYLVGLGLILSGGIGLQGANTHTLWLLLLGSLTHVLGWWILPASGPRRGWAAAAGLVGIWLPLTGPQSLAVLVLPYLAWLLVRGRPALSYLTALPVAATGILIAMVFTEYSRMPLALGIMLLVTTACAWAARWIAASRKIPSKIGEVFR